MTTGWSEALYGAAHLGVRFGDLPARAEAAADAGSASDAFAVSSSSEAMCLHGWTPEWPEAAIYVYL